MKKATANQVIDRIFNNDVYEMKVGRLSPDDRDWSYYLKLNKLFAPLEKDGLIRFTGKTILGKNKRKEKVWQISKQKNRA